MVFLYIEKEFKEANINESEYVFLLASLLVSIDKVANTSCVYGAYLKSFKKPALKPLLLQPIHTKKCVNSENNVYNKLAEDFSSKDSKYYDVIYLDPPYNHRQYSANYSPLNYIALYNPDVIIKGKTALNENYNKSNFCKKAEVKQTFTNLINGLNCNYLIISYNNEGLLSIDELKKILLTKGTTKLYKIKYSKFKAHKNVSESFVEEYLWVVDTTNKSDIIIEVEIDLVK